MPESILGEISMKISEIRQHKTSNKMNFPTAGWSFG